MISIFILSITRITGGKQSRQHTGFRQCIQKHWKRHTGTHACIMINDSTWKVYAFNNIIYTDDTINNDVYAFRIIGRKIR